MNINRYKFWWVLISFAMFAYYVCAMRKKMWIFLWMAQTIKTNGVIGFSQWDTSSREKVLFDVKCRSALCKDNFFSHTDHTIRQWMTVIIAHKSTSQGEEKRRNTKEEEEKIRAIKQWLKPKTIDYSSHFITVDNYIGQYYFVYSAYCVLRIVYVYDMAHSGKTNKIICCLWKQHVSLYTNLLHKNPKVIFCFVFLFFNSLCVTRLLCIYLHHLCLIQTKSLV